MVIIANSTSKLKKITEKRNFFHIFADVGEFYGKLSLRQRKDLLLFGHAHTGLRRRTGDAESFRLAPQRPRAHPQDDCQGKNPPGGPDGGIRPPRIQAQKGGL